MLHTRPAQLAAPMLAVLPLQASAPHYIMLVCPGHPIGWGNVCRMYCSPKLRTQVCRASCNLCTLAEMPIVWSDGRCAGHPTGWRVTLRLSCCQGGRCMHSDWFAGCGACCCNSYVTVTTVATIVTSVSTLCRLPCLLVSHRSAWPRWARCCTAPAMPPAPARVRGRETTCRLG